jgi:HAD superfamily hydrolase (TIGR01458 family)
VRADGVLLDIDGVLVVGWRAVPGAVDALAELGRMGIPSCCITNTTSHGRAELASTLADAGFDVAPERIVTAASATGAHLRVAHPGLRAFVLSDGDPGRDMPGVELASTPEDGEVMVVGGADETFGYDAINRIFRRVMEGAPLVAMHRSAYWRAEDGFHLDAGGYVAALEAAAGVEAEVCGKPAASFFAAALDVLGLDAGRAAMVGDDVVTDVGAAQAAGLTGVLVRTGKFREGDAERGMPDAVIGSVADLPAWLAS